ncbi:MAG: hypothetical protein GY832_30905 [Chloroflexi bacterium]|nr:hypothetical protein [Chloroflexota bacterium]
MINPEQTAEKTAEALVDVQIYVGKALNKATAGIPAKEAAKQLAPLLGLDKGTVEALILFDRHYPDWQHHGLPVYPLIIGQIIRRTKNESVRKTLIESYQTEWWTELQMKTFTSTTRAKKQIDEVEYSSRKQLVEYEGIPSVDDIDTMDDQKRREMVLNLRKIADKINYQEA